MIFEVPDTDHRDPGGDAAARIESGAGKGAQLRVHEQHEADGNGIPALCR